MESNRSWSIDDYRNKFQFGCEYGKLIENGELTKVVKNPNYRGITNPFWRSLSMVGIWILMKSLVLQIAVKESLIRLKELGMLPLYASLIKCKFLEEA